MVKRVSPIADPIYKIYDIRGKQKELRPTIHLVGSQAYNAFFTPTGNSPCGFLKYFIDSTGLKTGKMLEVGAGKFPVIPEIKGFENHVMCYFKENIPALQKIVPHAMVAVGDLTKLPGSQKPFVRDNFDIVFWRTAMVPNLKDFAGEELVKFSFLEDLDKCKKYKTYKAILGLYGLIKPGGYFLEFFPFQDFDTFPKMLFQLGLPVEQVELVKGNPEVLENKNLKVLDETERYYLKNVFKEKHIKMHDSKPTDDDFIAQIVQSPYAVMIIKKPGR